MEDIIEAIREKLGLKDNPFINAEIQSYLEELHPKEYMEFFKALSGDKFAYKNGLDRVAIVSASFKERKQAKINRNTKSKANVLASKLYELKMNCGDKYEHIKYDAVKVDNQRYFTNADLMVFDNLNMDELMKDIDSKNFQDSVDKINNVMEKINQAAAEKMAISLNDKNLLSVNQ